MIGRRVLQVHAGSCVRHRPALLDFSRTLLARPSRAARAHPSRHLPGCRDELADVVLTGVAVRRALGARADGPPPAPGLAYGPGCLRRRWTAAPGRASSPVAGLALAAGLAPSPCWCPLGLPVHDRRRRFTRRASIPGCHRTADQIATWEPMRRAVQPPAQIRKGGPSTTTSAGGRVTQPARTTPFRGGSIRSPLLELRAIGPLARCAVGARRLEAGGTRPVVAI